MPFFLSTHTKYSGGSFLWAKQIHFHKHASSKRKNWWKNGKVRKSDVVINIIWKTLSPSTACEYSSVEMFQRIFYFFFQTSWLKELVQSIGLVFFLFVFFSFIRFCFVGFIYAVFVNKHATNNELVLFNWADLDSHDWLSFVIFSLLSRRSHYFEWNISSINLRSSFTKFKTLSQITLLIFITESRLN